MEHGLPLPSLKLTAEALWALTHADTLTKWAQYLVMATVVNSFLIALLWQRTRK